MEMGVKVNGDKVTELCEMRSGSYGSYVIKVKVTGLRQWRSRSHCNRVKVMGSQTSGSRLCGKVKVQW